MAEIIKRYYNPPFSHLQGLSIYGLLKALWDVQGKDEKTLAAKTYIKEGTYFTEITWAIRDEYQFTDQPSPTFIVTLTDAVWPDGNFTVSFQTKANSNNITTTTTYNLNDVLKSINDIRHFMLTGELPTALNDDHQAMVAIDANTTAEVAVPQLT
jgi:hypothetical protein